MLVKRAFANIELSCSLIILHALLHSMLGQQGHLLRGTQASPVESPLVVLHPYLVFLEVPTKSLSDFLILYVMNYFT